jgi:hypothetical protein
MSDHVFRHAVGEELVLGIGAEVQERKDRDCRNAVGGGRRALAVAGDERLEVESEIAGGLESLIGALLEAVADDPGERSGAGRFRKLRSMRLWIAAIVSAGIRGRRACGR